MKKTFFFFILFCVWIISVQAQTPTAIVTGPGTTYVYVGSLLMSADDTGNSQKIAVKIIGGSWFSDSNGETNFYISNREGLSVKQVSVGSSSGSKLSLKAFQNGTSIDFYLVPKSDDYTSFAVTSFTYGRAVTSQFVTITSQSTAPTGTDITSTVIVSPIMMTNGQGYVGIGTASPSQPLTVPITSNAQGISLGTYASLPAGQFAFVGITGADGTFNGGNLNTGDNGSAGMAIVHTSGGMGNSAELAFVTHNNGNDSRERLRVDRHGNVGIGTPTPNSKLSVNGNIRAHEIKVETANWPDYVFAKDYQLPTLQETEQHIKDKGHLPGIPSAAEVKANGIDLGEMNAKLLQKIEELTLHLINQEKNNDFLNKQITELTIKSEYQQKEINKLKNRL